MPRALSCSRSVLNIHNDDEKCFLYCLLASLHPTHNEPELVKHYTAFENEIDMSNIFYPVSIPQINKVENRNENISINVFSFEDNSIIPLSITSHSQLLHHVYMLWFKNGETAHIGL